MGARIIKGDGHPTRLLHRGFLPLLAGTLLAMSFACTPGSPGGAPQEGGFGPMGESGDPLVIAPSSEDQDGDGVTNGQDNCPAAVNARQEDSDGDNVGDACDACPGSDDHLDSDGDGTPDCRELCPSDPNQTVPGQCGCGTPDTDCSGDSDSEITEIALNGASITVNGNGVILDGTTATLTSARTYRLTGTLADGRIIVNTQDDGLVRLILNGADISSSSSAPIQIVNAWKAAIILANQTDNHVADSASYVFQGPTEDEPNAAVFSKVPLYISGNGSLTVTGRYNDGIASKDGLIINSGTITVNAVDDGIRGKDYLVVNNGSLAVNSGGDGLKSDNADDADLGYIHIANGSIGITSGGDAITAETKVVISGGDFRLTTGGGSKVVIDESLSAKGIKGLASVIVDNGTFTIDAADDAVHSNSSVIINGGRFVMATGDDGIHADTAVTINGGEIDVTRSFEGIEGVVVTINNGTIHILSSDDGLNVAGDQAGTGYYMFLNGGYIVVNAAGDGIDVNGTIVMTGGAVIVNGPITSFDGPLDFDVSCAITGGYLLAVGSAGMAQAPSTTSPQRSVLINFRSTKTAGSLVSIQQSGTSICTFAPAKQYQSVLLSSPDLTEGAACRVYVGGSTTGTAVDGLYQVESYTPGTLSASFTVTGAVTRVTGN